MKKLNGFAVNFKPIYQHIFVVAVISYYAIIFSTEFELHFAIN